MARIRVVTDSACDLSAVVAAEHDVTIVPLSIRFGDEEFVDGRDLTTEEFWARCKASPVLPETSAPCPAGSRRPTSRHWPRPRPWPTASRSGPSTAAP
jgi:fatty acid-binding protein DegV